MSTTPASIPSPQRYARTGGALYLALITFGFFAEIVRDRIVVSGDAASTAARMTSMEALWRAGVAAEFVTLVCATVLALIYFVLLNPVSRPLNLLATFLRIVAIAVQTVALVQLIDALAPLGGATYLGAFTPLQRAALASLAIRAHAQAYGAALLLFGVCFLVHGRLIARSGFLPRTLGVMIQVAGACYVANSLAQVIAPAVQDRIFPLILLPCFLAETSLAVWLLLKGVDVDRWRRLSVGVQHP